MIEANYCEAKSLSMNTYAKNMNLFCRQLVVATTEYIAVIGVSPSEPNIYHYKKITAHMYVSVICQLCSCSTHTHAWPRLMRMQKYKFYI